MAACPSLVSVVLVLFHCALGMLRPRHPHITYWLRPRHPHIPSWLLEEVAAWLVLGGEGGGAGSHLD